MRWVRDEAFYWKVELARKTIAIIGAGVAGLSAGCYGQMNGYQTQVFEMQNKPGGLCTSWRRNGFTVDGCLQWLVGVDPGSSFYRIWEELGAIQGRSVVRPQEYMRVECGDGRVFTVYADINQTEEELLKKVPKEENVIREFASGVRAFLRFDPPLKIAPELRNVLDNARLLLRMIPQARSFSRWSGVSIGDFAQNFKDDSLIEAFSLLWFPDFSMAFLLAGLAWMHRGYCGYPLGGSFSFSKTIEERYKFLGGEVQYGRRVKKILVENGRAVGIRFDDDTEHRADYCISAADGRSTIFGMLEAKYASEETQVRYRKARVVPSVVQVALGVNRLFENMPYSAMGVTFALNEPVEIAGEERRFLNLHIYNHDPTLAPEGKTVVKVTVISDYSYWESLLADPCGYDRAKEDIGDKIVTCLDRRFPGLAGQVEMRDIATPVTLHRYTGNWKGSIAGWTITPESMGHNIGRTLGGLENFYMAGHWVDPIGVPMAALSGRNAIQLICRKDRRRFGATVP